MKYLTLEMLSLMPEQFYSIELCRYCSNKVDRIAN